MDINSLKLANTRCIPLRPPAKNGTWAFTGNQFIRATVDDTRSHPLVAAALSSGDIFNAIEFIHTGQAATAASTPTMLSFDFTFVEWAISHTEHALIFQEPLTLADSTAKFHFYDLHTHLRHDLHPHPVSVASCRPLHSIRVIGTSLAYCSDDWPGENMTITVVNWATENILTELSLPYRQRQWHMRLLSENIFIVAHEVLNSVTLDIYSIPAGSKEASHMARYELPTLSVYASLNTLVVDNTRNLLSMRLSYTARRPDKPLKRTYYYTLFTRVDILCGRDGGKVVQWEDWCNDALFVKRNMEEFELELDGYKAMCVDRILDFGVGHTGTNAMTIVPKGEVFDRDVVSGLPHLAKHPLFSAPAKQTPKLSRLLKFGEQWLGLQENPDKTVTTLCPFGTQLWRP